MGLQWNYRVNFDTDYNLLHQSLPFKKKAFCTRFRIYRFICYHTTMIWAPLFQWIMHILRMSSWAVCVCVRDRTYVCVVPCEGLQNLTCSVINNKYFQIKRAILMCVCTRMCSGARLHLNSAAPTGNMSELASHSADINLWD